LKFTDHKRAKPTLADKSGEAGGGVILVVEDEVLIRLVIAAELRNAGFVVLEAANAEEALAVLEAAGPVDAMITDVRMPGAIDGIELARETRLRHPQTKIIIASAQVPEWRVGDIVNAGFGKPYDPELMVEKVREILKASR
jgi:CheY-like chemotaxis protein